MIIDRKRERERSQYSSIIRSNVADKCFKICHIFEIQNPIYFFLIRGSFCATFFSIMNALVYAAIDMSISEKNKVAQNENFHISKTWSISSSINLLFLKSGNIVLSNVAVNI